MRNRRRKKPDDGGPSKAYMLSFGNMMTAQLAFFIVLNSLAQDQTGANLHAGTGSFVRSLESLGFTGSFESEQSNRFRDSEHSSPLYLPTPADLEEVENDAQGPDPEKDGRRVLDWEREEFTRFMVEMEHLYRVREQPIVQGQVVFDLFEPLGQKPPRLPKQGRRMLANVGPLLSNPLYRVEIVVWATTPSDTAWERACTQADTLRQEVLQLLALPHSQQPRLTSAGRPWLYRDDKRPVMSFVVIKTEPQPPE